jgi:RHS repeat-associated protein
VTNYFDGAGYVTNRVFYNSNKVQQLTWDGLGRLVGVVERDYVTNGFNWSAIYDASGRRLRTVTIPVTNSVTNVASALTVDSYYDPQVKYAEVAVSVNGVSTWKVLGPDINGRYGGMHGVGGLEATVQEADGATVPVLNDYFGNVLATIASASVTWSPIRVGAYGPVMGYRPATVAPGAVLAETLVWRSRWMDPSGLYCLGTRPYDPMGGHFLSPDPLGHAASMDLYSFCGGDPLNLFDADGRLGKGVIDAAVIVQQGLVQMAGEIGKLALTVPNIIGTEIAQIPIIGHTLGSPLQLVSAAGNFSLAAATEGADSAVNFPTGFALSELGLLTGSQTLANSGASQMASGFVGLADLAGKAWASPNDAIGLLLGIAGMPFGATPSFGHNAIQFANNPLSFLGDITFGNVINFMPDMGPNKLDQTQPGYTYGDHEEQHSYQSQLVGPLYLPLNLIGGIISEIEAPSGDEDPWHYNNFMENGPLSLPPIMWSSTPAHL